MVHRGARGQTYVYELAYAGEGTDGARFCLGLASIRPARTEVRRQPGGVKRELRGGRRPELAGGWRRQNGGMAWAFAGWR